MNRSSESLRELVPIIQNQLQVMQTDLTGIRNDVGAHKVTTTEKLAALEAKFIEKIAALDARVGTLVEEVRGMRAADARRSDDSLKVWLAVISALTSVALSIVSIWGGHPPEDRGRGTDRKSEAVAH